ncbi:ATP-binding protein [bacterium]|nr:ATP-binding protein [candidate division CSSED10-310 bacterium]
MMQPDPSPVTPQAPETFLVELNIPSDMDLIDLVVDLGTSMISLKGFSDDDVSAIRFAIHETLVNAIQYGNQGLIDARITVRFYLKGDCFYTDIEDEGSGFDPDALANPTLPENLLKATGRGIFLVRSMTEDFKVEKTPGKGVRVTFCRLKRQQPVE